MTLEQKEKITRFRNAGYGYAEIGIELGIPKETVKSFCRRNGINVVSDDKDVCRQCGLPLVQQPKIKKRKFCSSECREKWWTEHADKIHRKAIYEFICPNCGSEFKAYGNKHRKFCCHDCYIQSRFKTVANHG